MVAEKNLEIARGDHSPNAPQPQQLRPLDIRESAARAQELGFFCSSLSSLSFASFSRRVQLLCFSRRLSLSGGQLPPPHCNCLIWQAKYIHENSLVVSKRVTAAALVFQSRDVCKDDTLTTTGSNFHFICELLLYAFLPPLACVRVHVNQIQVGPLQDKNFCSVELLR